MKKNQKSEKAILLRMLREKQANHNIHYATTDGSVYRFFSFFFWVSLIVCTGIHLLFLLSQSGYLQATLANAEALSDLQREEITGVKNGMISVGVLGALLLGSAVFKRLEQPLFQIIFTLLPTAGLIANFATRLSEAIQGGDYNSLFWKHLFPLNLLSLCSLVCGIVQMRQQKKDKKGMQEISEKIYQRYSSLAQDISNEEWLQLLTEWEPQEPKSKKRSVKVRRKKQQKTAVNHPEKEV